MKTLSALGILLFAILQSAHATVAIYAGTETGRKTWWAPKNANPWETYHTTVYFVYELETGRSVEIFRGSGEVWVRPERNLFRLLTPRATPGTPVSSTAPMPWETILMDAKREATTLRTVVESVTWQGSRTTDGFRKDDIRPATGLPRYFPMTLVSRQVLLDEDHNDVADLIRTHVNSSVVLQEAATKASNAAGETFEAAILRVKAILERRGR